MSYRYQQSQFRAIGLDIDQIVNNQDIKELAKSAWKAQMAFKRYEDEKLEKQYLKDVAWWEKYSQVTVRHFLKYGDVMPIMKYLRPFVKFIIKNWMIWPLIAFLMRIYHA